MTQSMIREAMDSVFKFKVGDVCAMRSALTVWKAELELNGKQNDRYGYRVASPIPVIVLARELEECHGGFQPKYVVRLQAQASGSGALTEMGLRVMDHELVSFDEAMDVARSMRPEKSE